MHTIPADDCIYYEPYLSGLTPEMPDTFRLLAELLAQGQFELLQEAAELRLIYLMNDAAESFLVFHKAVMTGKYDAAFEGYPVGEISYQEEKKQYMLVIRQGEASLLTIFFEQLELETRLYNYGRTGHFWVKEYEYLRQIEFRIAILYDKFCYLGPDACTPEEQKLAVLGMFPPLGYHYYPAVPARYIAERVNGMDLAEEAVDLMEAFAAKVDDRGLLKELQRYRQRPTAYRAGRVAAMLGKKKHLPVILCLERAIRKAAAAYPFRTYPEEEEKQHLERMERAEQERKKCKQEGIEAEIFVEEPFAEDNDGIQYHIYLLEYLPMRRKIQCRITEY
ncbi:MAG: DUF3878 family protein [Eubacteriales bacterium]|nr:DUF3878 family protein [Eubacteriales bacterium]